MFDERFTGGTIARDDVHHAAGESRFLAKFGKRQRSERSELGGLQHDRVARRQCGSNFPCQHQQREVPRNHLPDNSAGFMIREFLIQQLSPSGVIVKMPGDQRDINVAAFTDGLAVIHGLQHGEQPRMFLNQSRQRIEVSRPHVE